MEEFRVRKEERRVPAEQHEPRNDASVRMARDVMIARHRVDAAEHCRVRPPAVPQKLDHGDHDRERDAGDGAKDGDTREAGDRQPEFPALDAIDPSKV